LNAAVKSLSSEYAREHIRFNAVAPGVVDSPLHANTPRSELEKLTPMGSVTPIEDIARAVIYLTEAGQITGEVLHVDGGAHVGKW
jgi:NAD(P)-dependent dehydrogenase (short-subunit alcohol dehydrogenase family)